MNKFYTTITDLPLRNFIDVAVNDNLHALVISGDPSIEDLEIAWHEISLQYSDAIGDSEHKLYIKLFKEVAILSATYRQIELLVELLTQCCNVNVFPGDLYTELNSLTKSSFRFSENDNEDNIENINRCRNRSKSIKLQIDLQSIHLKAMQEKEEGNKVTKEYFYAILISLSDNAKYSIRDDITVFEFCERVKRAIEFNKNYKPHGSSKQ